ncbi:origin recognition complex subunit 2 isoform X2 [Varanus komodoensis]|nr:origin recognition complex subunit 2 isoform X2 [Varanus komodoensis]XP_044287993.1 origin recognition complex subunit 2 isoform X2 [Varanus komodoensis]
MSNPKIKKSNVLEVRFVADEDVLKHISENTGSKVRKNKAPDTLDLKRWVKKVESSSEDEAQDILEEQDYVSVLGTDVQGSLRNGSSTGGGDVFSFQTPKRSNKMAEKACELAYQPGKNVNHDRLKNLEKEASTPKSGKKYCMSSKGQEESTKKKFVSETPYRLRKRITALNMCSDSESEYSASCSEEEGSDSCRGTADEAVHPETPTRPQTTAPTSKETSVKKLKRDIPKNLVEEYFEAHSSSKILTSDRTLQKLQKKKLDQETLQNLLNKVPVAFAAECEKLIKQHESLFYKWMLQLHLGFNIVLYGLGSKKDLLENFRISLLQNSVHIVVNGFFPSITVKSILNSITEEVLDHVGTFRSPQDQLDFIMERYKEDPSLELYLLIHNLDSQMLRGDKSQLILGQLSSLPNIYLIASVDHINAPLMWDQAKQSMYNWLWYETTTYSPYIEETSYENSLLIQRSGSLALSSLTHVLHSLTPNARGIFRLLVEYQLENKDNPSWPGLSFQDFYQQCREAFLVNSDLTLRAQLTEFRDHKLIRTKRGADGVEYLLIPVDNGTLTDFLQKNNDA